MKTFEDLNKKPEKGSKMAFWAAAIVAALVGFGVVAFLLNRPTTQEYQQQSMEGAFREGSPEFEALTKKIAIENDERSSESPTAMGTIQMSVWGKVRNLSDKTITGLELKVTVVDLSEKPIREKTVIVIPKQQPSLESFKVMPVNVVMDGFKKEENRANIHWKVTAIKTQ
jgi:hypothetical protein